MDVLKTREFRSTSYPAAVESNTDPLEGSSLHETNLAFVSRSITEAKRTIWRPASSDSAGSNPPKARIFDRAAA